jgi:hypothetical protein
VTTVPIEVKTWTVGETSVYGAGYTVGGVDTVLMTVAGLPAEARATGGACATTTSEITAPETCTLALLSAAMRVSGSNRVRYLIGSAAIPIGVVSVTTQCGDPDRCRQRDVGRGPVRQR